MVASWIRLAVVTIVGFVQIPVLFRNVPQEQLGVWFLLFAIATFINLSDLGLPSTFGRAVAFLRGGESAADEGEASLPAAYRNASFPVLYASALSAITIMAAAFASVALPAAALYVGSVLPPTFGRGTWLVPLALFIAGAVVNLVAAIPLAALSGRGDVAWDNAIRAGSTVFGFVLMVAIIPTHPTLSALCAIYLAQAVALLAASHGALVLRHPAPLRGARIDRALIRAMYAESAPIFVSRLGLWFTQESTLLVAGQLLGPARIPDFAVLRQIQLIGMGVTTAIPMGAAPHASAAHAAGDRPKLTGLYLGVMRYSMILNVLWTVGLLLWMPPVLRIMVGEGHFLGYAVLAPLALASLLDLHSSAHTFFAFAVGAWPFAPHHVVGGILNVVLGALGCRWFGFAGLAWGCMASQAVTLYWLPPLVALRCVGVPGRAYLTRTLSPVLGFGAVLALAAVLVRTLLPLEAASSGAAFASLTLGGIAATIAIAAALAWTIAIPASDRAYFARLVRIRAEPHR